jgi:hypothetical protein
MKRQYCTMQANSGGSKDFKKEKRQMILGMHRLRVPLETIAQASEITIEEVKKTYRASIKRGGL